MNVNVNVNVNVEAKVHRQALLLLWILVREQVVMVLSLAFASVPGWRTHISYSSEFSPPLSLRLQCLYSPVQYGTTHLSEI